MTYYPEIDVVDNIVDIAAFDFTPSPPKEQFTFASVGTLIDIKNFPLLIRAFHQKFGDNPAFQLKIGGAGRDHSKLAALIQELGLESQVQLLGRLTHDEVKLLFQESHVIVSSSHIETFGATLIEAMACGRPVIATRSGGPEGFVTEETGLLVENNQVDALAEGMQTLVDTYDQYDLMKIREYCVERFSEEAVTNKLLTHYRQICDLKSTETEKQT